MPTNFSVIKNEIPKPLPGNKKLKFVRQGFFTNKNSKTKTTDHKAGSTYES